MQQVSLDGVHFTVGIGAAAGLEMSVSIDGGARYSMPVDFESSLRVAAALVAQLVAANCDAERVDALHDALEAITSALIENKDGPR